MMWLLSIFLQKRMHCVQNVAASFVLNRYCSEKDEHFKTWLATYTRKHSTEHPKTRTPCSLQLQLAWIPDTDSLDIIPVAPYGQVAHRFCRNEHFKTPFQTWTMINDLNKSFLYKLNVLKGLVNDGWYVTKSWIICYDEEYPQLRLISSGSVFGGKCLSTCDVMYACYFLLKQR